MEKGQGLIREAKRKKIRMNEARDEMEVIKVKPNGISIVNVKERGRDNSEKEIDTWIDRKMDR